MKNAAYKFSIIIPVYNVEPYLHRCVDSVLNQSFSNFEIILVDDGLSDKSGKICDKYVIKDKRVKCIHQVNQGVSCARNTGLNAANGEYVLFIDSDDMWNDTEALQRINRVLTRKPETQVLCFGYKLFSGDGTMRKVCIPDFHQSNFDNKYSILKHLIYNYQYYSFAYTKAIKRDFLLQNHIFFVTNMLFAIINLL